MINGRGGIQVETLCCPRCRSRLTASGDGLACTGAACGVHFPLAKGVPVLIDERGGLFRLSDYTEGVLTRPPQSRLHALALRLLPSLDLNVPARRNAKLMRSLLFTRSGRPEILNIGGKHPRAALAALRRDPDVTCTECDILPGPVVALIADPRRLPFEDASFDAVFVDAVLEHCVDPGAVVDEIHRVLRPKGLVYADTPFMLAVHGGAYDFGRFSALAHRRLFGRFHQVAAGMSSGPAAALGYSIQSLLLAFARGRRSRFAVKTFCRLAFFWIKYIDYLTANRLGAIDGALGTFFIGERADFRVDDRELLTGYTGNTPDLYTRAVESPEADRA